MTNEEAIKKLEWALKNNTIYDENEAFEYILAVKMGIEALEQEPMLDKIRAEIKEESRFCPLTEGLERALEIIDKYNAEKE